VTKTQVRRFYNLVRVIKTSAESNKASAQTVGIKLRTLQAQLAYAVGRRTITRDFKDLFDHCIEHVINQGAAGDEALERNLSEFCTFFEAFYAYFYFHTEVRS